MASEKTVGVLGGGQLGRMLVEAANLLEIRVNFLDAAGSSAKQVSAHEGHVDGSFKRREAIQELANRSDVVTVEIEHVNTDMLEEIANEGHDVQPSWKTIRTIQNKYLQKCHLKKFGVASTESAELEENTIKQLEKISGELGLPLMLKSKKDAYDGRGNFAIKTKTDFKSALDFLGAKGELYAEKWANFRMELAVMVVKTKDGVFSFPTVETIHEDSICKLTYAPARGVSKEINKKAQELAKQAVACFWGKGVFGVEMFLLMNDELLINEIAPRPHNSGHYTIEGCPVSQYEAHLRAILDLPLHQEDLELREPSIMLNILGGEAPDSHLLVARKALEQRRTKIHLYGKGEARKGRKMGHITVCAPTMSQAERLIQPMIDFVDRDKPKPSFTLSRSTSTANSNTTNTPAEPSAEEPEPLVAVIMGSDSDLPVLQPGLEILKKFSIPFTVRITSAHRTPQWMADFTSTATTTYPALRAIIAAAGGAAHLPGMAAAYTSLPVIGVPVKPSIGDGMDSLLSICNMPRGVPVATVSINNSVNAALLATRIIGSSDVEVRGKYEAYMQNSANEVRGKDETLARMGYEQYAVEFLSKK
ncbi:hypothetical protein PRZ48_010700 [Zasmidium cellare]|uniref:Phosphoribosylaminoimidazole carboxylase n=1 Tax=Zasmidium cellare TaxID=395010 RepID=A0ABR0E9Q0_ZASCE|nr:hypothetical protein PRZ48_010700 [Zasmidium cellare]